MNNDDLLQLARSANCAEHYVELRLAQLREAGEQAEASGEYTNVEPIADDAALRAVLKRAYIKFLHAIN